VIANANSVSIPMADGSAHCIITSPPYWGLRNYGLPSTEWPTVTYTPMAGLQSVTGQGCEPRWEHEWGDAIPGDPRGGSGPNAKEVYADGGKSVYARQVTRGNYCQLCGGWRGCLGLEPTPEMFVAHIVGIFRELWRVLRDDGTLWLNFGDSYAAKNSGNNGYNDGRRNRDRRRAAGLVFGLKPKDLVGSPWRVAFALQADGWYLRNDIIWHKPNPMPESITDRCTKSHEYIFLMSKRQRYYYDNDAVREPSKPDPRDKQWGQTKLTSRHDHKHDAQRGMMQTRTQAEGYVRMSNPAGRNRRTVWTIPTSPYSGAHFATFPPALATPCILAGTSAKGVCPVCGAPWERVVEREAHTTGKGRNHIAGGDMTIGQGWEDTPRGTVSSFTIGWRPTCEHDVPPVPATVLDPFCGSGTVGQVCGETGRKFVGLDLSSSYLRELALPRAERMCTVQSMAALPLFAGVE